MGVLRRAAGASQVTENVEENIFDLAVTAKIYFTVFIHPRIGPVTETSAVLGEKTSDMWL
jgi:hypothetical protein